MTTFLNDPALTNSDDSEIRELVSQLNQNPEDAQAWSDLGLLLWHMPGYLEHARTCYEKALHFAPEFPLLKSNLGLILLELIELDAAKAMLEQAVEESGRDPIYINNLVTLLLLMNDTAPCIPLLEESLSKAPRSKETQILLGILQLTHRDYLKGFVNFNTMLQLPAHLPVPARIWQGEDLTGKRFLFVKDHEFGDIFQMLRYAKKLKSMYEVTIITEVPASMASLVSIQPYIDEVLPRQNTRVRYDNYDYAMFYQSLPIPLKETWENLYSPSPYIQAPPLADPRILSKFDPAHTKLRIGVVWEGRAEFSQQAFRIIPFDLIQSLITDTRFEWYSFQKGQAEAVFSEPTPPGMIPLGPYLTDWAATSYALQQIDLLIACDTGIVHLAGAMGIPTWVGINTQPDWRWSHTLSTTPWYPSVRLFRQIIFNDWTPVIKAIKEALNAQF